MGDFMFTPHLFCSHYFIKMVSEYEVNTGLATLLEWYQPQSLYDPAATLIFCGQFLVLHYSICLKQTNADSVSNVADTVIVPNDNRSTPVLQENCYAWPALSPNYLMDVQTQSSVLDGCLYPASHGQYIQPHLLAQVPVPIPPQNCSPSPDCVSQKFEYFVVIDFEATCDKETIPRPQEIIEFPSVVVNSRTGRIDGCFQCYVRPTHHQLLTGFCKQLTGIEQSQVDNGVTLKEALFIHDKWLEEKGIKHTNFAIVTWTNWDCRIMLESECQYKRIMKPSYFNRWINLKIAFLETFGYTRRNLKESVEHAGLKWEGKAHCGLDDAKNTARLLSHLIQLGYKFSITNSLQSLFSDHPNAAHYQQKKPDKSKTSPILTEMHFPPHRAANPMEEPVFCFCGATCIKKVCLIPGQEPGGFFFACGNFTADRGPSCPFFLWAADSTKPVYKL